jgi:hypothetical protein
MVKAESQDEAFRKIESAIRSYLLSMNVVLPAELASRLQMTPVGQG